MVRLGGHARAMHAGVDLCAHARHDGGGERFWVGGYVGEGDFGLCMEKEVGFVESAM